MGNSATSCLSVAVPRSITTPRPPSLFLSASLSLRYDGVSPPGMMRKLSERCVYLSRSLRCARAAKPSGCRLALPTYLPTLVYGLAFHATPSIPSRPSPAETNCSVRQQANPGIHALSRLSCRLLALALLHGPDARNPSLKYFTSRMGSHGVAGLCFLGVWLVGLPALPAREVPRTAAFPRS